MILLVGASASGKTEVAKALASHFGITKAITHTTRPMRQGERNDVDYHFVSEDEFLRLEREDAFVETTFYNGNHYGCSKKECGDDKCIILDPAGIASFLALNNPRIVTFFLRCDEATRKARMISRGDDLSMVIRRLQNDAKTFDEAKLPPIDFVLDSDQDDVLTITRRVYDLYQRKLKG